MIIIIGLGNPGEQYKNTRHNVGFLALDKFAEKNNFPEFSLQKKTSALISEHIIEGQAVILVKPQTFMNESGKSAASICKNYKLKAKSFVIVHDDIDLPAGKIKIVAERGSAGHKGVESIVQNIGNTGLVRIRIGIGPQDNNIEAKNVVLKKFSDGEKKVIDEALDKTAKALDLFIREGLEKTMNEYNK